MKGKRDAIRYGLTQEKEFPKVESVNFLLIAGQGTVFLVLIFFTIFSAYSFLEKEIRACVRSSAIFIAVLGLYLFCFEMLRPPLQNVVFVLCFLILVLGVSLLLSRRPRKITEITGPQEKVDERDVIFARFDLKEKTEMYEGYYNRKPEFLKIDEEIREIPDLLSSSHTEKNPFLFSLAAAEFDFLEHQLPKVSGDIHPKKAESSPLQSTLQLKKIAKYLGSDACGICLLNESYVYSHVGRGPEPYGKEIELRHRYAIALAVEMDLAMIVSAPGAPVIVETGKKYVEAAKISVILAEYIRRRGYAARAHIAGSNYQTILPPIAWEAGIGEVGRLGILITEKFGPRARLGLVTTDMPLIPDKPKILGIQDFCTMCLKCARNCPAQAIPFGEKSEENGSSRWIINREACYRFWRKAGTDCAVCIHVCPYSKANNIFHTLIRGLASLSKLFQVLAICGDDFFYGRSPRRRKSFLENNIHLF